MSSATNSHPLTFFLHRESSYFLGLCSMVRGCEPERSDLARVGARVCDLPGGLLAGAGAAYRRRVPLSGRQHRTTFSHSQTLIRGTLSLRSDPRALRSHSHPSRPFLGLPADRSPYDRQSDVQWLVRGVDAGSPAGHILPSLDRPSDQPFGHARRRIQTLRRATVFRTSPERLQAET